MTISSTFFFDAIIFDISSRQIEKDGKLSFSHSFHFVQKLWGHFFIHYTIAISVFWNNLLTETVYSSEYLIWLIKMLLKAVTVLYKIVESIIVLPWALFSCTSYSFIKHLSVKVKVKVDCHMHFLKISQEASDIDLYRIMHQVSPTFDKEI